MNKIDLQPISINPALQLKACQLLHKINNYGNIEFLKKNYWLQHQDCGNINIYLYSNNLQQYQEFATIYNVDMLVIIKDQNRNLSISINKNKLYLHDIKQKIPIQTLQFFLFKDQKVFQISQAYQYQNCYLLIMITNQGNISLITLSGQKIRLQQLKRSINLPKYFKMFTSMLTPTKFYEYCTSFVYKFKDKMQPYLIVGKQLQIQNYFLQLQRFKDHQFQLKWSRNLQPEVNKNCQSHKISQIWYIHACEPQNDKFTIIIGCTFANLYFEQKNTRLIVLELDFITGDIINKDKNQWIVPSQSPNMKNCQIVFKKDFIYFLQRDRQCRLYKIGVTDELKQIRYYDIPYLSSLCFCNQSLFLLAQTETYIIETHREQFKEQFQNYLMKQQSETELQQISYQLKRKLQKHIFSKEIASIEQILQKKKQKYKEYLQKIQKCQQQSLINKIDINIDILKIQIILIIIKRGSEFILLLNNQDIEAIVIQLQQYWIINLMKNQIKNQNILLDIVQHFQKLIMEDKSQFMKDYLNSKYFPVIKDYIERLDPNQISQIGQKADKLIQSLFKIMKIPIQIFKLYYQSQRRQILRHLLDKEHIPQLFIYLFCQQGQLDQDYLAQYIKRQQEIKIQKVKITQFILQLLSSYLVQMQGKKQDTLKFLSKLENYYQEIYQYLKNEYPNLAWIIGLKLKKRNPNQIVPIARNMSNPKHAKTLFIVVEDKTDNQYLDESIIADFCGIMNIPYMQSNQFVDFLRGQPQILYARQLPMNLWNQIKEKVLKQIDNEEVKKIQRLFKLI